MTFKPGASGNPTGRPPGAKDRRTELREMLKPHAQDLVNKAVELALAGDSTALRLCIDRLMPPLRLKDEPATFPVTGNTLAELGQAVIVAMGSGHLSPDQGSRILTALTGQAKLVELDELEKCIRALEARLDA